MNSLSPDFIYPIPGVAEPLSALSHLIAAIVFFVLARLLVRRTSSNRRRTQAIKLYAYSVVALLLVSGLFHVCPRELVLRNVLQRLDHAVIFIVIAATFTAIHSIVLEGIWRWGVLSVVWGFAAVGVILSVLLLDTIPESVWLGFYLGLGWLGLISGLLLWLRFGFRFIEPLLLGAVAYTLGAIVDFLKEPVLIFGVLGSHELFHFAVLAGLGFHWKFISGFVHVAVAQCTETRAFTLLPARPRAVSTHSARSRTAN